MAYKQTQNQFKTMDEKSDGCSSTEKIWFQSKNNSM